MEERWSGLRVNTSSVYMVGKCWEDSWGEKNWANRRSAEPCAALPGMEVLKECGCVQMSYSITSFLWLDKLVSMAFLLKKNALAELYTGYRLTNVNMLTQISAHNFRLLL